MKNRKPWNFCETPKEKCTMNYCDENGCQNRKRNYVEGNDLIADVSSSVSKPSVRVRFYPKDTDLTFDGTLIEETQYSYLVAPDDNLTGTARWNKRCCDILN